ncbi:MAG: glycosyltransferase family 2 protein [Myxococcota bacterium]
MRDLTLVVIDDGSDDDSFEHILKLKEADPRVELHRSPARGLVPALNFGLTQCAGPYVARMDADDWSAPNRIEKQLALCDAGFDLVGTRVRMVGGGEGFARYASWQNTLVDHESMTRELFVESPIAHPSVPPGDTQRLSR